jgi:hypothetical protein
VGEEDREEVFAHPVHSRTFARGIERLHRFRRQPLKSARESLSAAPTT